MNILIECLKEYGLVSYFLLGLIVTLIFIRHERVTNNNPLEEWDKELSGVCAVFFMLSPIILLLIMIVSFFWLLNNVFSIQIIKPLIKERSFNNGVKKDET